MNNIFIEILEFFSNKYILFISTVLFGVAVALSLSLKSKEKSVLFSSVAMVLEVGPISYLTFLNLMQNEFYNPKSPLEILFILMAAGFLIAMYIMCFLNLYRNIDKIENRLIKIVSILLTVLSIYVFSNLIVNLIYIILRFVRIIKGVYY